MAGVLQLQALYPRPHQAMAERVAEVRTWIEYRYTFLSGPYFVSFPTREAARAFRDELMYRVGVIASVGVLEGEPTKEQLRGKP